MIIFTTLIYYLPLDPKREKEKNLRKLKCLHNSSLTYPKKKKVWLSTEGKAGELAPPVCS
jgi:hypothetical protein